MCYVRLNSLDEDGKTVNQKMAELMWEDIRERINLLGVWIMFCCFNFVQLIDRNGKKSLDLVKCFSQNAPINKNVLICPQQI